MTIVQSLICLWCFRTHFTGIMVLNVWEPKYLWRCAIIHEHHCALGVHDIPLFHWWSVLIIGYQKHPTKPAVLETLVPSHLRNHNLSKKKWASGRIRTTLIKTKLCCLRGLGQRIYKTAGLLGCSWFVVINTYQMVNQCQCHWHILFSNSNI